MDSFLLTSAHIHPELSVWGNRQTFFFGNLESSLTLQNLFTPTKKLSSRTNFEFKNAALNGFRFQHQTSLNEMSLNLYSFINGNTTPLLTFSPLQAVFQVSVQGNEPQVATELTTKNYVDNKTWISSQITDLATIVQSYPLNSFALPIGAINMNSWGITNLPVPLSAGDAATKAYVDSRITAVDINNTNGQLNISRLSGYPASSAYFLGGNGSWNLLSSATVGSATNASYATTAGSANSATSASYATNAGYATTANTANTANSATSASYATNAGYATTANTANIANSATSASYATNAGYATTAGSATNATYAGSATNATYADSATNANYASSLYSANGRDIVYSNYMWTLDCFSQSGLYGSFYAYYGPGRSNDPVSTAYALFKVGGGIICETLYATSSKKIKNIIGSVNIDNLRERFSKIKFQEYTHKDVFLRGDRLNYGVIAEQLNESFPEFVQLDNQDFIPNFLRLADTCSIFGKFLTLTFRNPIPELEGEKLKIFVGNSSYTPKIVDYNDASISVFFEDDAEWNLVTAAINNGESVFVYGTFEKCPAVIKEKLFEVGMILLQDAMIKIDNLNKK